MNSQSPPASPAIDPTPELTLLPSGATSMSKPAPHAFRPGRHLIVAAAVFGILGLFAFVWPLVLAVLCAALLPLAFYAWRDAQAALRALNQLEVTRSLPQIAGRNLPFVSRITVTNTGPNAVQGELRDVLPRDCQPRWVLAPFAIDSQGGCFQNATECRIPIRGRQRFGPAWIRVSGPLKLMEVQRETSSVAEIRILPETFASREQLQKDLGAALLVMDKVSRSRQLGAGTEFVSLDAYRHGDDPRRIDWRATARHRSPIVRRFQIERHRDVLILIDCGRLMGAQTDRGTKLDCAVDSALNLARVALQSGDRCGIGMFDSKLMGFLSPLAGTNALSSLVQCVYDVQTQFRETDFTNLFAELQRRQSKRSLLVILSDLSDAETSRMNCAALARLHQRHLVLFAALQTPVLKRILQQPADSVSDGARQAVSAQLLGERGRALFELQRGGIHVIDVEPQQLTLPLINQFIELRQRNLL